MKKKIFDLFLVIVMLLTLFHVAVAAESSDPKETELVEPHIYVTDGRARYGYSGTMRIEVNPNDYIYYGCLDIYPDETVFDIVTWEGLTVTYTNKNDEDVTRTITKNDTHISIDDLDTNMSVIYVNFTIINAPNVSGSWTVPSAKPVYIDYSGYSDLQAEDRKSSHNEGYVRIIASGFSGEPEPAEPVTINSTQRFYYTTDGKTINLKADGIMDFAEDIDKNIVIACYDNGILVKTEIIPLSAEINGLALNDLPIELSETAENLTVKAFAWSGFDECIPLCEAAELTDVPESAFKVRGCVVNTCKEEQSLDNGMVVFSVESSDNFDGEIIDSYSRNFDMYVDNTDIEKHLFEKVDAYITKDANDEYHILKYTPVYENQVITLTKSDINIDSTTADTLVTNDGLEININSLIQCYVNGVIYYDENLITGLIKEMSDNYAQIKLIDEYPIDAGEGDEEYDYIFVETYNRATIEEITQEEETVIINFSNADDEINSAGMELYTDDDWYVYNFMNENGEKCSISQFNEYIGKNIYVSYDMTDRFSNSRFYDIILEGAEKENSAVKHEDRLSSVNSSVVLRYSDTYNTGFLDGMLNFDSDGNMPFDITVSYAKNGNVLKTEIIKTTTLMKKLVFGYEDGEGIDYNIQGKKLAFEEKPDKITLSFDDTLNIADIDVPVVNTDVYKVYGRVTNTFKTDGQLNNNQVKFRVEKADNFDGDSIQSYSGNYIEESMYYSDSNALNLIGIYSQAYIHKEQNGEYTIEAIMPLAVDKAITLMAEDFDDVKSDPQKNYLYFYPAGTSQNSVKYAVADDFRVYINGVYIDYLSGDLYELVDYISYTEAASITLIKETKMGSTSTDSDYNLIMISAYGTAIVKEVAENSDNTQIDFLYWSDTGSGITVYNNDVTHSYSFTLDGEKIDATELMENDILNIAYDIEGRFGDSSFYDVIVSRDKISGSCTAESEDGDGYTINGVNYKAVEGLNVWLQAGETYTLCLDSFGRIAAIDWGEDAEEYTKCIGILKNIYKKTNGDWYAQIITSVGTEKEYLIDDSNVESYKALLGITGDSGIDYSTASSVEKYVQQVIEYKVNTSGQIIIRSEYAPGFIEGVDNNDRAMEYKETSARIGRIKISGDTEILDISNDTVSAMSVNQLVDGTAYEVFGYDKSSLSNTYRFVLIKAVSL